MIGHVFKIVRNSWKSFCGIFIEQMVVCVVLMLVVVSVFVTLSKMYSPGLARYRYYCLFRFRAWG